MKLKNIVIFAAFGVSSAFACELPKDLKVNGNKAQVSQVCEAYKGATRFFSSFGYQVDSNKVRGSITFEPRVTIPEFDSKGNPTFSGGTRVLGLFDRNAGDLRITDEKDPWIKHQDRTYFKLQYTPELYQSVILHEMVHLLSKQFYQYSDYGHAQEEYIAYAAQIWSLSDQGKSQVVGSCGGCNFSNKYNINDIVHFSNPHAFGVMSYNHFVSQEGYEL